MRKEKGMVGRLLSRNVSKTQLAGFVLSNFIGLAIVITGIQFYADVRSIWEKEDSFIRKDYLVINKKVTASNTTGAKSTGFTKNQIEDIGSQYWSRDVGEFEAADYNVYAFMKQGERNMSTSMFFESIPDKFIDVNASDWKFQPGDEEVPLIISKDYLTLYNFGFASASGMPQLTETTMKAMPLDLRLNSHDGMKTIALRAKIVGFSNRLNTILVPQSFMEWSNTALKDSTAQATTKEPSRLIIDVSSPGDVAINEYLDTNDYELAGDKSASQAAYFLNIISGLIVGVGALITILSFFILLLSVALLMQKNREKLHLLIMLGLDLGKIGRPYEKLTVWVSVISLVLAMVAMIIFRNIYIRGIEGINGGENAGIWLSLCCGVALTILTMVFNIIAIRRKVKGAFYK